MKYAAWWSVGLVSTLLWLSCSSDGTTNEDEDGDDGAGSSALGGASGSAGSSAGGVGNRGGGSDAGATNGGEDGAGGDPGRGGTAGDASGSGGGGNGEAGDTATGGGGTGAGGSAGTSAGNAGAGRGGSAGGGTGGTGGSGGCVGLECQVIADACPSASRTTLSGTVYAPNGTLPIYNARVYVPRTPALDTLDDAVSCKTCSSALSGSPIAVAASDASGRFVLSGVPSGSNVPFVIEMGKWRRSVTIPTVTKCVDNPITNTTLTRLPRNRDEGHIPHIAITTGGSEALECLPRRLGIDDTEITTDGGGGRIHLYAGGDGTASFNLGGAFAPATALWSDRAKLMTYDMVLLSCEGSTSKFASQKPQSSIDNLTAYADAGGRVLFTHLHYYWLQRMMGFSATANYIGNLDPPPDAVAAIVNQSFPKGAAFAQWLTGSGVGASTTLGQIALTGSEHSVTAVTAPTVEWISLQNPSNNQHSSQVLSFNTPLTNPEASQCGRSMFADIHFKISVAGTGGDDSDVTKPFPTGCRTNDMSPQGKALAFLFFDLSACVQPDRLAPVLP